MARVCFVSQLCSGWLSAHSLRPSKEKLYEADKTEFMTELEVIGLCNNLKRSAVVLHFVTSFRFTSRSPLSSKRL